MYGAKLAVLLSSLPDDDDGFNTVIAAARMAEQATTCRRTCFWLAMLDPAKLQRLLTVLTERERARQAACFANPPRPTYSASTALQEQNAPKNRYADVIPYDSTRCLLQDGGYINANWITCGSRRFIASQGPTESSVTDFWSLCLGPPADRPCMIVMLTAFMEAGRQKCFPYLPPAPGTDLLLGTPSEPQKLRVSWQSSAPNTAWHENLLEIHDVASVVEPHSLVHLQYEAWPDHGTVDPEHLLALADRICDLHADPSRSQLPILIHCSAGVGRTGTLIAMLALLDRVESNGLPTYSDQSALGPLPADVRSDAVSLVIDSLREQRIMMVERKEQFLLVHDAYELFQRRKIAVV
ncbi:uncharacterized protein L969DRAFT_101659 [Mixia osmundae IAM 14324]|uniref:Tyrosine specific protein phosphatases domain-containing protein n=1 Tax=Mixia osmundae (strain CBS 9802 / IAM 14324 / JCM 22182 / KY 12970) TaxID=764103 RepID=G7DY96_MIXOS|nr:uncharacterized protein L969DRAFT_101659 [Mixia osmundae IAM 14324]KEI41459.1 hypothetical protein L969DRAFT_101659 [Mixia osmundae IAM 14324]GAA95556.1 hypothetical protein E5Q_02211 [Mixia osmundae IAM 14324]